MFAVALVAVACSGGGNPSSSPSTHPTSPASPTASASASGSPGVEALIATLPDGCAAGTPATSATVAFVAGGRAWAAAPDGAGLTCLFQTDDPGPFLWGPQGDRVAVGGLQVLGVGSDAAGPSLARSPDHLDWGHPKGLSLVFPSTDATDLQKVEVGTKHVFTITPFPDRKYGEVIFHPSGLALAFVALGPDGSEVDVSSNTGSDAKRLVFTQKGTVFGPIAFDGAGTGVLYGARLADGTRMLAKYDLDEGEAYEKLWVGDRDILSMAPELREGNRVALTVGSGCTDAQAIVSDLDGSGGTPALPQADAPTSAVGWLDDHTLLVSSGTGCGPQDLWTVDVEPGGAATLLAQAADRVALRVPAPSPPPKLPPIGVTSAFG